MRIIFFQYATFFINVYKCFYLHKNEFTNVFIFSTFITTVTMIDSNVTLHSGQVVKLHIHISSLQLTKNT